MNIKASEHNILYLQAAHKQQYFHPFVEDQSKVTPTQIHQVTSATANMKVTGTVKE